jgi:hypothetical protein
MRFFRKLGRGKNDPLRGKAELLVSSAGVNAVTMFVPMVDQHPLLKKVNLEQWDFVLTIAGVFMGATRLQNLQLRDDRQRELMEVVSHSLTDWSPKNGIRGFEDCKKMFERNFDALTSIQHEPRFIASDAIGMWIVWNLLQRPPEAEEERRLVRAIGVSVVHNFFLGGAISAFRCSLALRDICINAPGRACRRALRSGCPSCRAQADLTDLSAIERCHLER